MSTRNDASRRPEREKPGSSVSYEDLSGVQTRFLEVIFESVADSVFVQDADFRVIFANAAAAHSMGYATGAELVQAPVDAILKRYQLIDATGSSLSPDRLPARRAIVTRQPQEELIGFRSSATGEDRWSMVRATPVLGPDGVLQFVVSAYQDVTEQRRAEEALRASEARFRTVIEQSPISTQIFSIDGTTILVNRAWEELWGVTLDQIRGYNILQDHQLVEKGVMSSILRAFAGESTSLPTIKYEPDQTIPGVSPVTFRWVAASMYPVKDQHGAVKEVVLMHEDITDRMVAEEVRDQHLRQLETVIDHMPAGVIIADAPSGKILLGNRRAEEIWRNPDLVSLTIGDPLHWRGFHLDGRPILPEEWPLVRTMATGETIPGEDFEIQRGDGSRAFTRVGASPIRNRDGTIVGGVVTLYDITEDKERERRQNFLAEAGAVLMSSLDYQTTLTSVARLAVPHIADWCVVDVVAEDGSLQRLAATHVDPAKEEMARDVQRRYPASMADESGVAEVIRRGRSVIVPEISDEMLVAGSFDDEHLRIVRELGLKSGMIVPISSRDSVFGAITFIAAESGRQYGPEDLALAEELARRSGTAIDNAHLFQAEKRARSEAQEALRVREEFLSIASHELKTPLTALQLQIQMLRRSADRSVDRLPIALEGAERQVKRLTRLVEDLLDVSRITAGQLPLEPEEFDLAELAREVLDRFHRTETSTQSPLILHAGDPVIGHWDRMRVDQVITNLVDNAIKYGGGQPVEVTVDRRDDFARLMVADRGIGIPPEDLVRIFDRFERVASAKNYGGLGLGLHIVRQILDAHRGRIAVSSDPDEGTRFTVELPLNSGEV